MATNVRELHEFVRLKIRAISLNIPIVPFISLTCVIRVHLWLIKI